MRIIPIHSPDPKDYSATIYWVLGDQNHEEDCNTLVDTGSGHPSSLSAMATNFANVSKGIGKQAVEQVLLTHNHYDHAGGLSELVRRYPLRILARDFPETPEVMDGQHIRVGDRDGRVIWTPGHSPDSICLYLPQEGLLFSGDTLFRISDESGTYSRAYLWSLNALLELDIRCIYPGHGEIIREGARKFLEDCARHVSRSALEAR